ncbi:hypothetical protein [Mycobacteroides abscessus]|uniref:hypothetical protein n=1 Tax=Mycobacteroides abscessus TaxID=36809 RepID=UPI0012FFFE53|nr:hypothetical protein [Mycobacteroides abscessus]
MNQLEAPRETVRLDGESYALPELSWPNVLTEHRRPEKSISYANVDSGLEATALPGELAR